MNWVFGALKWFLYLFITLSVLVIAGNIWIVQSTSDRVFFSLDQLPNYSVALVLGTSPFLADGSPNSFFNNRMKTATKLYKRGKIVHLIASGDNRTKYYNEPAEMRKELIKQGVPASAITLDYAGLRTLDSIVRGKEIFGQKKFIIVTQAFHSYRALFIAKYYGIDAVALAASEPSSHDSQRVYWREYLARAKAALDLYVFKTKPRYMGKQEPLTI